MISPFMTGKGGVLPLSLTSDVSPYKGINPSEEGSFSSSIAWQAEGYTDDQTLKGSIGNSGLTSDQFELKTLKLSSNPIVINRNPMGDSKFFKDFTTNIRKIYEEDTWYEVVFRYVLNDIGFNNGISQVWIDGVLVQNVSDYNWRAESSNGFKKMLLSFFPGGNDISWEVGTDRHVALRDITLSTTSLLSAKTDLNNIGGFQVDCSDNGFNSLRLSWASVDADCTHVLIERSNNGTSWVQIASVDKALFTYIDSTIETNTLYNYRAKLNDNTVTYNDSSYSNITTCYSLNEAPIVISPTSLTASAIDSSSMLVSWQYSDPSDNVEIVIQQSSDGVLYYEVGRVKASYELDKFKAVELSDGVTYYFRIYAQNNTSLASSLSVGPASDTTPIATTPPTTPCVLQYFITSLGWVNIATSGVVNLVDLSNTDAASLKFRYNCNGVITEYPGLNWNAPFANDFNIDVTTQSNTINLTKYHNTTEQIISNPSSIKNIVINRDVSFGTTEILMIQ